MPKITYVSKRFAPSSMAIIETAEQICEEYAAQGYDLTLRQLYYQFVSRALIPNKKSEYKRLGSIINDARLAGLIDWEHITDRTRNVKGGGGWDNPAQIIRSSARTYHLDKWENQAFRPEIWIEKDALSGVFSRVAARYNVPMFSCRGYTSQSEVWSAAQRMLDHASNRQQPVIFHFGDHDPSGIDMSRDIRERLAMFGVRLQFERLALNMDQVEQYNPPPNPAKTTDSRFAQYIQVHGDESWELDALEPNVLANLVEEAIEDLRDDDLWNDTLRRERSDRRTLTAISDRFDDVREFLDIEDEDEEELHDDDYDD